MFHESGGKASMEASIYFHEKIKYYVKVPKLILDATTLVLSSRAELWYSTHGEDGSTPTLNIALSSDIACDA